MQAASNPDTIAQGTDPFALFPKDLQFSVLWNLPPNSLKVCSRVSRNWRRITKSLVDTDQRVRFLFFINAWTTSLQGSLTDDLKRTIGSCVSDMEQPQKSIDVVCLQRDLRIKQRALTYLFSHVSPHQINNMRYVSTPIPIGFEDFKSKVFQKILARRLTISPGPLRTKALIDIFTYLITNQDYSLAYRAASKISHPSDPMSPLNQVDCLKRLGYTLIDQQMFREAAIVASAIPEMVSRCDLLEDIAKAIRRSQTSSSPLN